MQLTYGNEGFAEIKSFILDNNHKNYSLAINDELSGSRIEVLCDIIDIPDVVSFISTLEHDFPDSIVTDEQGKRYIVNMKFVKGRLKVPYVYEWKRGRLLEKFN